MKTLRRWYTEFYRHRMCPHGLHYEVGVLLGTRCIHCGRVRLH